MIKVALVRLSGIAVHDNKLAITPKECVVLSGRRGPMSEIVNMCEQARALFENQYHFEDIEPQELLESGMNHIQGLGYQISDSAIEKLTLYLEQSFRLRGKNFENLNFVKKLIENRILPHLIERSVKEGLLNSSKLHCIEVVDIPHI